MTMMYAFLSFFDGSLMILLVFNNFPFVDAFFLSVWMFFFLSVKWGRSQANSASQIDT